MAEMAIKAVSSAMKKLNDLKPDARDRLLSTLRSRSEDLKQASEVSLDGLREPVKFVDVPDAGSVVMYRTRDVNDDEADDLVILGLFTGPEIEGARLLSRGRGPATTTVATPTFTSQLADNVSKARF